MSKYLITGGAGFIGSNIVEELVKQGQEVRILDNFSTGKKENLSDYISSIEIIEGDIRDVKTVRDAVGGVDFVLHQAALTSVPRSIKDPEGCNEVNVVGTLNVLLAARDAKVKRLVYASSSSLYGDTPTLPKSEDMKPNPKAPYAVAKLTGEYYCQVFSKVYGLETVSLRYFNVFGPKQDPDSEYAAVIPKFINMMINGKSPTIYGDGQQSRDFTFVKNVVAANLLAIKSRDVSGEVFNIACGDRYSLLDLVDFLNDILKKKITSEHVQVRGGDVKHSLADISRAKQHLDYAPVVDFKQGLAKAVKYYLSGGKI